MTIRKLGGTVNVGLAPQCPVLGLDLEMSLNAPASPTWHSRVELVCRLGWGWPRCWPGRGGGGGGGDQLDPGDQGGPGAGQAPLRHRHPHHRAERAEWRSRSATLFFWNGNVVSTVNIEAGIWAMRDARWSDENCSVSVENNKTGN